MRKAKDTSKSWLSEHKKTSSKSGYWLNRKWKKDMLTLNDFVSISFVDFSQFSLQWIWIFSLYSGLLFYSVIQHTYQIKEFLIYFTNCRIYPTVTLDKKKSWCISSPRHICTCPNSILLFWIWQMERVQSRLCRKSIVTTCPFSAAFKWWESSFLLDCRISMFETTTSFLKERV